MKGEAFLRFERAFWIRLTLSKKFPGLGVNRSLLVL